MYIYIIVKNLDWYVHPHTLHYSILFVVNPITSENNIMCTFMSGQTTYAFKGNFKHLTTLS